MNESEINFYAEQAIKKFTKNFEGQSLSASQKHLFMSAFWSGVSLFLKKYEWREINEDAKNGEIYLIGKFVNNEFKFDLGFYDVEIDEWFVLSIGQDKIDEWVVFSIGQDNYQPSHYCEIMEVPKLNEVQHAST